MSRPCEWCSGPLTGRNQVRFCSKSCAGKAAPRLSPDREVAVARKQRSAAAAREKRAQAPEETRQAQRDYYAQNKARVQELRKARKYGLTVEELQKVLRRDSCDLCGVPFAEGQRKCVDHSHVSGKFRGVLCNSCNVLLGMAHDDPETLLAAIGYLGRTEP